MSTSLKTRPEDVAPKSPLACASALLDLSILGGGVLVTDPELVARIRSDREATDAGQHDEMWEGVSIISPLANPHHQWIATKLSSIFLDALPGEDAGRVYAGLNVSDRDEGWTENFREPDVAVILAGNPGVVRSAHFQGGPDLVVEILSPNDLARQKLPFYAGLGVREVLIVDRDPWAIELYRLDGGTLAPAGRVDVETGGEVASAVLPLSFGLTAGEKGPRILVRRRDPERVWTI